MPDPNKPDQDDAESLGSAAGVYEYLLGGRTLPAPLDAAIAQKALASAPEAAFAARENRAFVRRAVRELARRGIRQFIDLGAGFPTHGPLHEAVFEISEDARIVYVDNDPGVALRGRELVDAPNVTFVTGDLREPWLVLDDPGLRDMIDLDQPVAMVLAAVLHFVSDDANAREIVAHWRDRVVHGSYLLISHAVAGEDPDGAEQAAGAWDRSRSPMTLRTPSEVDAFFAGCELIGPGLVTTTEWGTDEPAPRNQAVILAGVGKIV